MLNERRAQKESVELIPPEVAVAGGKWDGTCASSSRHSCFVVTSTVLVQDRAALANGPTRRTDSRRRQTMTTIHSLLECLIVETRLSRCDANYYCYSSSPSASSSSPIASSDAGGLPAASP
jgi:hypothetical protein